MLYTANDIDTVMVNADKSGIDQREQRRIVEQMAQMINQENFSMRKTYKKPLTDEVLKPFCESTHITVKEHINKDIYKNTLSYEYTFIYDRGDEFDE